MAISTQITQSISSFFLTNFSRSKWLKQCDHISVHDQIKYYKIICLFQSRQSNPKFIMTRSDLDEPAGIGKTTFWQFWIEGGIGPRDASTTPIGPQRTAHLAAVEKTCTPSEIKEVNSCYSLCLKKLFVTNSEKKKTIFKYGMPTTRQQGWQFFVEPKQFQITHWFWPTTLKSIWNWPTDMMVQFELNH